MEKINLISVPAYVFYASDSLIQEVSEQLYVTKFQSNETNEMSTEVFFNLNLFNWFESCLAEVKNIYYNDDLELKITSCWATKATYMKFHKLHGHVNSVVSGSFYCDNYDSQLEFYMEDPWLMLHNANILGIGKTENEKIVIKSTITPKKGMLILFPSSFQHKTHTHSTKTNTRFCVAFNSFLTGKFRPYHISAALTLTTK